MFTFLIPTHCRPHMLRRALKSLEMQTCQEFKVIISDSSPVRDVISGPNVTYFHNPGLAHINNFNFLSKQVDSGYWMFLEDDDFLLANDFVDVVSKYLSVRRPGLAITRYLPIRKNEFFAKKRFPYLDSCMTAKLDGLASVSDLREDSFASHFGVDFQFSQIIFRYDLKTNINENDFQVNIYHDETCMLRMLRDNPGLTIDNLSIFSFGALIHDDNFSWNNRKIVIFSFYEYVRYLRESGHACGGQIIQAYEDSLGLKANDPHLRAIVESVNNVFLDDIKKMPFHEAKARVSENMDAFRALRKLDSKWVP